MTPDRHSNRTKLDRPPDRGRGARAVTAAGVPEQVPTGQMQAAMTTRQLDWGGERLSTAGWNAPITQRQRTRSQSTPIAQVAWGVA
jgi:hypothetical protein